ncbi:MAG: DNA cytosine methyltransferase [Collinsella sp.]|nr:DNA cytosine methyltransferase [Collinsella sp.]
MRYISLFSGIEAASVAWGPLGWEPMAFAEIEPFCCELLEKRFPAVPNLGDVSGVDWSSYRGKCDLIIGGSPCQAFSVAGNRKGLDDPRGRLMLEYARAVRDVEPRWVLWENVPGVLSQDGGQPLVPSSGSWKTAGILSHGECLTLNSSEYPSDAAVSFLSDILEPSAPRRFYLSPSACKGLLRRAQRRGKSLPPQLEETLLAQASSRA